VWPVCVGPGTFQLDSNELPVLLLTLLQRPSQIRRILEQDNMPVAEWPADDSADEHRQSYNFAPGYHGVVYRADTPDWGAGPRRDEHGDKITTTTTAMPGDSGDAQPPTYRMQTMKWGLIPFWTKRRPDYGSLMKTINCRDDSLSSPGGMWASIKGRKRCIVIAQGFFEWLKAGPKDKVPHYIKRKDGHLMCLAGLWDCAQYEGPNQGTDEPFIDCYGTSISC
jgi:putative SOS response-associated peptidase YedK